MTLMLNHRNLSPLVDFIQEPVGFLLKMNVDNLMGDLEMSCDNDGSLFIVGDGGGEGGEAEGGGAGGGGGVP